MEHWDAENTAITAELEGRDGDWIALDIRPFQRHVRDLDHLLCLCRTPKAGVGGWMHDPDPRLLVSRWRVVHRSGAEAIALAEVKRTELGLADASGVLQHGLEHGLQLSRRAADDLQHISGGGLLLEGFAQFPEQPRIFDGDDSLLGEVGDEFGLLYSKRLDLLAVNC